MSRNYRMAQCILWGRKANERFLGEKWCYTVEKEGTHFYSFLFNGVQHTGNPDLLFAYRALYDRYRALQSHAAGPGLY
jgi:hypothetical protein